MSDYARRLTPPSLGARLACATFGHRSEFYTVGTLAPRLYESCARCGRHRLLLDGFEGWRWI